MNLGDVMSEARNPQTLDLEALTTIELVSRFNQQDALVAEAVKATLPDVGNAVDAAAASLKPVAASSIWGPEPAGGWGCLMHPNVRQRLACRTGWRWGSLPGGLARC